MARPAAFLDRDGTIIHDPHYIARPEQVALIPGAAVAICQLTAAGVPVVVITNQSGIARGLLTERDYDTVRARLDELLAAEGAHLLDTYMCPHHPDLTGPCECRKPGTLLHRRAAAAHDLDLARSHFIGDRWHDASPARAFGARGILVPAADTPRIDRERAEQDGLSIVASLADGVREVLKERSNLGAG